MLFFYHQVLHSRTLGLSLKLLVEVVLGMLAGNGVTCNFEVQHAGPVLARSFIVRCLVILVLQAWSFSFSSRGTLSSCRRPSVKDMDVPGLYAGSLPSLSGLYHIQVPGHDSIGRLNYNPPVLFTVASYMISMYPMVCPARIKLTFPPPPPLSWRKNAPQYHAGREEKSGAGRTLTISVIPPGCSDRMSYES